MPQIFGNVFSRAEAIHKSMVKERKHRLQFPQNEIDMVGYMDEAPLLHRCEPLLASFVQKKMKN